MAKLTRSQVEILKSLEAGEKELRRVWSPKKGWVWVLAPIGFFGPSEGLFICEITDKGRAHLKEEEDLLGTIHTHDAT